MGLFVWFNFGPFLDKGLSNKITYVVYLGYFLYLLYSLYDIKRYVLGPFSYSVKKRVDSFYKKQKINFLSVDSERGP